MQTLRAVEVAGPARWRWVLTAESGRFLADHEVDLDAGTVEYEAFCDLMGFLDRQRLPHDPVGSEAAAVDRVSAWISEHVFGRALLAMFEDTVRVVVPRDAEFMLARPLELAQVSGVPLTRRQVSLVYEPAGSGAPGDKEHATESMRILALFSMPARSSVLALRRERYELTRIVRTIAAKSRKAIELRVLQYGVTRARLAEAVEEFPGWDVLHVSGHGGVGALLLEQPDGEPDLVSTAELIEMLAPARRRLKLAVLSACQSGAAEAVSTLQTLGLDELAAQVDPHEGRPASQVGLARGLVEHLGVTALAMRYPVADGFAVALARELYPRLLGAGQPVGRAVALALPKAAGRRPTAAVPAASIGTPMLIGAGGAGLRVAPPPGRVVLDPYAERMAWFPPEPERFVGRTQALIEASTALAPESGRVGVLFVGMVGAGKSACALELAHQHRGRFGALAWWQAPDQPDEFGQALVSFAAAMEAQLGIPMLQAVGSEAELRNFLPRLAAVLREEAVLLVLDNVDTLLSGNASWRDPMWGMLAESLFSHGGLSRVVLTSRVAPDGIDSGIVAVLPVHSLSAAESVLLVRELPHLGALLGDVPTAERTGAPSVTGRQLIRRVLNMAQGHPKLLELADAAAAEPGRLAEALAAAEAADRDAPVMAFFATGASALDGGQYLRLLTAWTDAALSRLPARARMLAELLARLEEDERRSWIVRQVWELVWQDLHGEEAPPVEWALEPLVSAVLVEAVPVSDDDLSSWQVYRLHPGVGEVIRAGTDHGFGALVDEMTAWCLEEVYEYAHAEESRGGSGSAIVWAGLAAAPYLLRSGRIEHAASMLDAATDRVKDPNTTSRALGYVRRMLETTNDLSRMAALHAKLVSRSNPQSAVTTLLDVFRDSKAARRFDLASIALAECVEICCDNGNLEEALELSQTLMEMSGLAGYGPWTEVADQCLALTILDKMGKPKGAEYVLGLAKVVEAMPDDCGSPERVTPVSVREVVLSTALGAVCDTRDWDAAMDICERISRLHQQRGASAHERARLQLNTASVLLKQDRVTEAEEVLRQCQAVFEDAEDVTLLGDVFRLRAEVQDARERAGEALTMAQAGLRYSYHQSKPGDVAAGHDAMSRHLADAGYPAQTCLAHRLAAEMLRAAVAHEEGGVIEVELSDLLGYGADLWPRTLAELVEQVEQIPGVRLEATLRSLVPDETDRGRLFDSVAGPLRTKADIAQHASANHREERAALVEALHRADAGERSLALIDGLDEASATILLAFIGTLEKEAEEAQADMRDKRQQEDTQPPSQEKAARRSPFRGRRRARKSREALLDVIRARVAKSIATGTSRPVTGRRVDAAVYDLLAFAQDSAGNIIPDIEIMHAIGWLYWQRFVTLIPDDDESQRDQWEEARQMAVMMLRQVFHADPTLVPDMLREAYEQTSEDEE